MIREFLHFLNQNAGALTVIFGAVVAIATVVYARLTAALVNETNRMRRVQTDPDVLVAVQPSEVWINLIELVVENVGGGSAYNLRLQVAPDVKCSRGEMLSSIGLFKHGMRQLAPQRAVKTFLFSVAGKDVEAEVTDGPYRFVVTLTYETQAAETVTRDFDLDLLHLVGMVQLGTPPLKTIAESLKGIKTDLGHLSTGFSRLSVNVHTEAEVEAEHAEQVAEFHRRQAESNEGND